MSTTDPIGSTKSDLRSRGFVVVVLVLLYMAQPALALVGIHCQDHSCGGAAACRCSESTPAIPTHATVENSCCASDQPATGERSSSDDDECGCRSDSNPVPASAPVLPPEKSNAAGGDFLTDWVRTHAESSAYVLSGPAGACLPPRLGDGADGRVPPPRAVGDISRLQVSSLGAWALLTRGVTGLLTLLSSSRN